MTKTILVTGATGQQGGSVVRHLIESNADVKILALTRNPEGASAKKLLGLSDKVKIVKGDFDDTPAIFEEAKKVAPEGVWGVFSVQVNMGGGASADSEERQGKAFVDAALAAGVKFFVYTSVDRGGEKSLENPTPVPHFICKHNIEKHLLAKTTGSEMEWCILRPVAFMDNFAPNFFGKIMATWWKDMGDKKLQLIAVSDIGHFAADAFLKPEEYNGVALSLAGDDLSYEEGKKIFEEKMGYELPETFGFVGSLVQTFSKEMSSMFKWFKEEGYGADIPDLKRRHPGLEDFGDYLVNQSAYEKKK